MNPEPDSRSSARSSKRSSSRVARFVGEWLLGPLVATIAAAALMLFAAFPIGWAALTSFVLWPVVGHVVTSDDELPGGWANPDGTAIPFWELPEFWGRMHWHLAISCLAFAIQHDDEDIIAVGLVVLALILAIRGTVLIRRGSREE